MINLLQETINKLLASGKNVNDVSWVGSRDGNFTCSWHEFTALADREYDNNYGGIQVARDLVVVGKNWWLERHEHDSFEWWVLQTVPKKNQSAQPVGCVFPDKEKPKC